MTLIWGSLKFVLLIAKSHYETLYKFTDMMIEIGTNLERIQLCRHVFPTSRMLQLVSQLYAAVVEFLQGFILYLKHGSVRRVLGNLTKPFDLEFGRLVARIRSLEQTIEKDAYAGAILMQVAQTEHREAPDRPVRTTHIQRRLLLGRPRQLRQPIPPRSQGGALPRLRDRGFLPRRTGHHLQDDLLPGLGTLVVHRAAVCPQQVLPQDHHRSGGMRRP